MRVGVINLSGGVGLKDARSPFDAVDEILERI
jgi:calcineurin-like phosphoesterase